MNHLTGISGSKNDYLITSVHDRMIQSAMSNNKQLPVDDSCLTFFFFAWTTRDERWKEIQSTNNGSKLRGRSLNWRCEIIIELFKITFWILNNFLPLLVHPPQNQEWTVELSIALWLIYRYTAKAMLSKFAVHVKRARKKVAAE